MPFWGSFQRGFGKSGGFILPPATFTFTDGITSINEGSEATFAVSVDNSFWNGQTLYWSIDISNFTLSRTIDNPNTYNTAFSDGFGFAVAVSQSYTIVSAVFESDANATASGAAYIFDNLSGTLLHTLTNPNYYNDGSANDQFGYALAINENYAVVGVPFEDEATGTNSGKVYVYSTTTGTLLYALDNPNPYGTPTNDNFGVVVDISDTYLIVGASSEDTATYDGHGKAYIFELSSGSLIRTLDNPDIYASAVASDLFGWSVRINETHAFVGSRESEATGFQSGRLYVFEISTGNLIYSIQNPNDSGTPQADGFSYKIDISDSYIVASAQFENSSSGVAYIFDITDGTLLHTLTNPNIYSTTTGDFFGDSVAITDTYTFVGASQEDDAGGSASGAVYVFDTASGSLITSIANPNAFSTSAGDQFASAMDAHGTIMVVGAKTEDEISNGNSGKAYVFTPADISSQQFLPPYSGSTVISSGSASFSLTPRADFLTEFTDKFRINVRQDSQAGDIVARSNYITINDTSQDDARVSNMTSLSLPSGVTLDTDVYQFTGRSLSFDGTQTSGSLDFDISSLFGTQNTITIETWVYLTSSSLNSAGPWSVVNGTQTGAPQLRVGSTMGFYMTSRPGTEASQSLNGAPISLDQWILITHELEYNGTDTTRIRTYVDGTAFGTDFSFSAGGTDYSMPGFPQLTLGNFGAAVFNKYIGRIGPTKVSRTLLYNSTSCTVPTAQFAPDSDTIVIIQ